MNLKKIFLLSILSAALQHPLSASSKRADSKLIGLLATGSKCSTESNGKLKRGSAVSADYFQYRYFLNQAADSISMPTTVSSDWVKDLLLMDSESQEIQMAKTMHSSLCAKYGSIVVEQVAKQLPRLKPTRPISPPKLDFVGDFEPIAPPVRR